MLPIVDKPLIQYAVEEAVAAGIDTMIFITGRNKWAITDHLDKAYELETELIAKKKFRVLEAIQGIVPPHVNCIFIRQAEALGLGHAVLCAKPIVGNEPFAVILADDLVEDSARGCMKQMTDLFAQESCSILGVERIDPTETEKYGIVQTVATDTSFSAVESIIEKPQPEVAPSNLAVIGRYILTPAIFAKLEKQAKVLVVKFNSPMPLPICYVTNAS